jgi:hypothetical protein
VSPKPSRGRLWAYTGAILGGGVSVAANVAHSFLPPLGAPDTWRPEPGAVVGAIVWPVFLFIAVEILARIVWPSGRAWVLLRFGGLLPVAAVAAFVSYRHLSGLLAHYGEEDIVVLVGPIAVDGLMLMATGALLAINHRTRAANTPPVTAPTAAVPAAVSSAAAAPVAPVPVVAPAPLVHTPVVPVVAEPARSAASHPVIAPAVSHPPVNTGESATSTRAVKRPAAAPAPSTTNTSVTASDVAPPKLPVPAAQLARAAHIAQAHLTANGAPITVGELAVRMRVGSEVASQIMAVLDLQPDSPTKPIATVNGSPVKVAR